MLDLLNTYLTGSNMTIEDNTTPANYEVQYGASNDELTHIFINHNRDLIFNVKRLSVKTLTAGSGPIGYQHRLSIQPVSIFKWNTDGSKKVDGLKLVDKACQEVRRIVRTYADGSFRETGDETVTSEDKDSYGLIHGEEIIIHYFQDVTAW